MIDYLSGNFEIRLSKIAALMTDPDVAGFWVLLDGGHVVAVTKAQAVKFSKVIADANRSDVNFFGRGG